MSWTVETLDPVDAEIEALPPGLQARLLRLFEMVENSRVGAGTRTSREAPRGSLWELRAKALEGIARGIYVTASGRRVVVLHVFVKKTQKTPRRVLEIARARMKQVRE